MYNGGFGLAAETFSHKRTLHKSTEKTERLILKTSFLKYSGGTSDDGSW